MKSGQLQVLLVVASILLGVGLFAPCMTLQPSYGNVTWLARLIDPDLVAPTTYSLLDGIRSLLTDSNVFIGVVVLLFSVVFPLWKLGVYWVATAQLAQGQEPGAPVRWVNQLGKWSMLDVFVLAVLVVAVKGLPGGSRVAIEWGAAAFCASVLLSIYISLHITKTSAAPTEP
jgi:paraquat-inducible protein A